jgi:hypothetical protein
MRELASWVPMSLRATGSQHMPPAPSRGWIKNRIFESNSGLLKELHLVSTGLTEEKEGFGFGPVAPPEQIRKNSSQLGLTDES